MNHNVGQLIHAKRQWHTALDSVQAGLGFLGWHSRGYLPHFDIPGVVQMLNYRLENGLPATRRQEWAALLTIEEDRKRRIQIEAYLDRGHGCCMLREPRFAAVVEDNWRCFDGQRYRLLAWVVMPNHVHLMVEIWQTPLAELVKSWKGYTARQINRVLSGSGKVWQDDYWDRYIRDEAHFRKAAHYIEWNPVMAGLVKSPADWPFSSARFRDEYNQLQPPMP